MQSLPGPWRAVRLSPELAVWHWCLPIRSPVRVCRGTSLSVHAGEGPRFPCQWATDSRVHTGGESHGRSDMGCQAEG